MDNLNNFTNFKVDFFNNETWLVIDQSNKTVAVRSTQSAADRLCSELNNPHTNPKNLTREPRTEDYERT